MGYNRAQALATDTQTYPSHSEELDYTHSEADRSLPSPSSNKKVDDLLQLIEEDENYCPHGFFSFEEFEYFCSSVGIDYSTISLSSECISHVDSYLRGDVRLTEDGLQIEYSIWKPGGYSVLESSIQSEPIQTPDQPQYIAPDTLLDEDTQPYDNSSSSTAQHSSKKKKQTQSNSRKKSKRKSSSKRKKRKKKRNRKKAA